MATYRIEDSTLTAIGDAIRTKRDSDALIAPEDMAAAILGIETGGGGSADIVSGSFTLASDTSVPTTGYKLPFKLDRMPDILIVWLTRESFLEIASPASNRYYRIVAYKAGVYSPVQATTNIVADNYANVDGYVFHAALNRLTNTASPNGYALQLAPTVINANTYPNWRFTNGELTVAKATSATQVLYKGEYRYMAIYGEAFII